MNGEIWRFSGKN